MFGEGVLDEITSDIFLTKGYPQALSVFIVVCIAIIPLTKVPLKYVRTHLTALPKVHAPMLTYHTALAPS